MSKMFRSKSMLYLMTAMLIVGGAGLTSMACTTRRGIPTTPPVSTATLTSTATAPMSPTMTFTSTPTPSGTWTAINTSTPTATISMTSTPTRTATIVPPSLNLSGSSITLTSGIYDYSCITLGTGSSIVIEGAVTIYTGCFTLDAGATISGAGNGDAPGSLGACAGYTIPIAAEGYGQGYDNGNGCVGAVCGGAGHGGNGGTYCYIAPSCSGGVSTCSNGGGVYDDPIHPSMVGSHGGWPGDAEFYYCPNHPAFGGAALCLVVYNPTTNSLAPAIVDGTIDMSGNSGPNVGSNMEPSGGGSGGSLVFEASTLSGSGSFVAVGGTSWGGGGGGGIISLIANRTSFTGTTNVAGGTGSGNGGVGIVSYSTPPTSGF